MERLFVTANNYTNPDRYRTKFIAVRYGNVLGSSNSVIPKFVEQIKNGNEITVTDPNMTRFNITMDQAIDLIFESIKRGFGGEVFVPKLKSYKLDSLKECIFDILEKRTGVKKIPIRPGEKIHESLINSEEIRNTYEIDGMYVILDKQLQKNTFSKWEQLKETNLDKEYSSDKVEILSKEELEEILRESIFNKNE